jgi:hypothetical protein
MEDTNLTFDITGTLITEPDARPPQLFLNPAYWYSSTLMASPARDLFPFDDVVIRISEALRPPLSASFVDANGGSIPLVPTDGQTAPFASLRAAAPNRLWVGQTYALKFDAPATDMAGNPAANDIGFRTVEVPSYPNEDFESTKPRYAEFQGGQRATPSWPAELGLPAIAGNQSLYMGPVSRSLATAPLSTKLPVQRFAMRLPVATGNQKITLKIRRITTAASQFVQPPTVTVFNRQGRSAGKVVPEVTTQTPIEGTGYVLGPIETVSIDLPPETSDEVLLVIDNRSPYGGVFAPSLDGLLADDITIE